MLRKSQFNSQGQVLLIVVVTMIVALTAGLSIASRTITNLQLSKQNEESQRAFQAASAGIEKLINAAAGVEEGGSLENAEFQTKVLEQDSDNYLLNNGGAIDQDRGMDIWLSAHPNFSSQYTGNFTLYFGTGTGADAQNCTATSGKNVMPALEIVMLEGTTAAPTLEKYVYDPCGGRRTTNNFAAGGGAGSAGGVNFQHNTGTISVTNGLVARVVPIYNSAIVGVRWSAANPPVQGKLLESTGTSGETQRRIVYFESLPQIPVEVFPYVIMSQ